MSKNSVIFSYNRMKDTVRFFVPYLSAQYDTLTEALLFLMT